MIKYILFTLLNIDFLCACAVCYGAPNDPVTIGLNKAILFLLFIIVFVLSCLIYGIFSIYKRSNQINL